MQKVDNIPSNAKYDKSHQQWQEFEDCGLLWLTNTILSVFGWYLDVVRFNGSSEIKKVYPSRTRNRGYTERDNEIGYAKISSYMYKMAPRLFLETRLNEEDFKKDES